MRVERARAAAADWVRRYASRDPGFGGAYFSGSIIGMPDAAELPVASDVDVVVVVDADAPKLGKFDHLGALLEVTYLSWDELGSPQDVLANHQLAGGLRTDTIIADPTGRLRALQDEVSRRFAEPGWVRRRCESVLRKIGNGLRGLDVSAPWHAQVMAWLFTTGVTRHVPLVAALRDPTVRLRYLAAHRVLDEHGLGARYPEFLELLGCAGLSPRRVASHVDELARTFDATAAVSRTPFFFSSDITPRARPIAIDGSRELIRDGRHREAVFWIVATFARCHTILHADADPAMRDALTPPFQAILADLGITSSADLRRRAEDVSAFLPRLRELAETILRDRRVAR